MLNPPVNWKVTARSTTERDNDTTTRTVFFLFLPRFARAMRPIPALLLLRCLLEKFPLSVYFTASTGDTFAAIRPGRPQERSTVTTANKADTIKITGELLTRALISPRLDLSITTGTSRYPTAQPAARPGGHPMAHSSNACWRMILFSCRGVTPIVFKSP